MSAKQTRIPQQERRGVFEQEKSKQTESSRMKRFPEDSVIIREGEVRNENLSQYKISNENRKVIPFGERCMTFFTIFLCMQ